MTLQRPLWPQRPIIASFELLAHAHTLRRERMWWLCGDAHHTKWLACTPSRPLASSGKVFGK